MAIKIKKSHKGLLHKNLGVPEGEKIPASKLKIKSTDSPAVKKRKQFALNAKKFKHAEGGMLDEPTFNIGDEGYNEQLYINPQNNALDFQIDINNPYAFDPALTKSLQKYIGATPQLTPIEQTQYDAYNKKPKLNINSLQFTPLTGNKYLNRGFNYLNQATNHASNITFKKGGLVKYDNGGNPLFNSGYYNFNDPNNPVEQLGYTQPEDNMYYTSSFNQQNNIQQPVNQPRTFSQNNALQGIGAGVNTIQ